MTELAREPWMVMRSLLGEEEADRNYRSVWHNDRCVAVLNRRMDEWHAEDTAALQKLCAYLNSLDDKLSRVFPHDSGVAAGFNEARKQAAKLMGHFIIDEGGSETLAEAAHDKLDTMEWDGVDRGVS